ncbi:MAG: rhomboid family intramembrane serine protease [Planctomycetes bacterium]|nr:rhomboid family intramembrane serine protease [Planctomycetota bacterium]
MASENRDWMRPSRRNRVSFPRWSVTAWIIAACVAIFVIDGFLAKSVPGWMFLGSTTTDGQPIPPSMAKQVASGGKVLSFQEAANTDRALVPIIYMVKNILKVDKSEIGIQPLEINGEIVGFAWYQVTTPLKSWLYFSTSTALWSSSSPPGRGFELWRFIGFQFLHANLSHLLFNMIGLYFFGPLVERYLGGKRYLAFYLICGIAGAGMYLLLNFLGIQATALFPAYKIPFVLVDDPNTPLVGASAGIFGVIMAAAYLAPTAQVLVFFILPMPLRTLAYTLVAIALLTIYLRSGNAGGEAAHLGGAIAGYWFIRHPDSLHGMFNWLGRADPTSRTRKLKASSGRESGPDAATVDRILDKIRKGGLQALTDHEREILREASRRSR